MPQCLSGPQFRTLKYCPEIPERFGSFKDGMPFGPCFFIGYNEQRHRGIALLTPAAARHSNFEIVIQPRKKPLKEAFRMRAWSVRSGESALACSADSRVGNPKMDSENPALAVSFRKAPIEGIPEHEPRQIVDPGSILEAG